ncbi:MULTISPECIES: CvpA family protein [unclassified Novosphingobium]|uniref:CvpA family protein n=1 Tax=unclassified Novosphingobium TaxID=2644732 RepID=UPI00146E5B5F|nr:MULTISPECIES: CvpA family protein [unclassified Novosphingobium]NMN04093.1 membrane protein required for colicin V production [Novosphingobium sp. SG919]NMN85917.1 membrane protein required for colicin V production [Novosphingobium sp. SG916]
MTGFDYVVFLVVAVGAIGGFFRGFVEEVLSLAAWCIVLVAVHYGLEPLTAALKPHLKTDTGAGVLAYALLMIVPWGLMRLIARRMGAASRDSMLGPIDRLLGFGFGAVKGAILMVLGFALVVFAYDVVWGVKGRPEWITEARTYPFLNAASEELVSVIAERRAAAAEAADDDAANADGDAPAPKPTAAHKKAHHRKHPATSTAD